MNAKSVIRKGRGKTGNGELEMVFNKTHHLNFVHFQQELGAKTFTIQTTILH